MDRLRSSILVVRTLLIAALCLGAAIAPPGAAAEPSNVETLPSLTSAQPPNPAPPPEGYVVSPDPTLAPPLVDPSVSGPPIVEEPLGDAPLTEAPLTDQPLAGPPGAMSEAISGEPIPVEPQDGVVVPLNEANVADAIALSPPTLRELVGYDTATGGTTWIIANNDRFGWVSLESFPILPQALKHGLVTGLGFHFLDGPVQTDMPPRLFDFSIGYQVRQWIWQNVGFDIVATVGVYSDFEGSAREGVRFPGHGVVFMRMTPACQLLLGVDELDRDDLSLLPVFGAVWAPQHGVRIDAVFPRPAAAVRLGESNCWMFVRGQLGGGTWAIERANLTDDNATYRDLRLAIGVENHDKDSIQSALEIGYVFARELTYRTGVGDMELQDAVMISLNNRF